MHLGCMTTVAIGSNSAGSAAWAASTRLQAAIGRTTTMSGAKARMSRYSSSRSELALERQRPDSLACRGEDCVGHRGCRDRRARLTDPPGGLAVAYEMHFDRRCLVDPQHANVVEVRLLHPAVLDRHLTVQGAADSEDDAALDLRFHGVRVHDGAAVHRADDPVHAHLARLRHRHLGDLGQIAAPTAVEERDTAATAGRQRLAPTGRLRRDIQNCPGPRRFAEESATISDGILLRRRGELVDETLDHEGVVRDSDAAPEAGAHYRLLVAHVLDLDRGDVVEQLHRTVQRIGVDPVLERGWRPARDDRRADDPVRPRDRLPARVQSRRDAVVVVRAIHVVLDVLLAGPDYLHGPLDLLGDAHGLRDVVELESPAESAAQEVVVHDDLLEWQA